MTTARPEQALAEMLKEGRPGFLDCLGDGQWHQIDDVRVAIPDDLALARYALSGSLINDTTPNRDAVIRGTYSLVLASEIATSLVDEGVCEVQEKNGNKEIRSLQSPMVSRTPAAPDKVEPIDAEVASGPLAAREKISVHQKMVKAKGKGDMKASKPQSKQTAKTERKSNMKSSKPQPQQPEPRSLAETPPKAVDPNIPVHEHAKLFPSPDSPTYMHLKEAIKKEGQLVPAWTYQGKLLDGRSRARACKELGRKLLVREWDGEGSLVNFVVALNLNRRHLTQRQRALVGAAIKKALEAEAQQRMKAGKAPDPEANLPQGRSRDLAARMVGVSGRSIDAASTVLEKGVSLLVEAAKAGEVSVAAAAEVARLPPAKQEKIVFRGTEDVVVEAQKIRKQRWEEKHGAAKTDEFFPCIGWYLIECHLSHDLADQLWGRYASKAIEILKEALAYLEEREQGLAEALAKAKKG